MLSNEATKKEFYKDATKKLCVGLTVLIINRFEPNLFQLSRESLIVFKNSVAQQSVIIVNVLNENKNTELVLW